MKKVILLTLLFLSPAAVITAPEPAEALGGQCFGIPPLCGPGLHPACVCYDAMGNNCSWQCVR